MIDIIVHRQSYAKIEIDEIRQIYDKNNLADIMTKASLDLALKRIIIINKATIRLERWVKW